MRPTQLSLFEDQPDHRFEHWEPIPGLLGYYTKRPRTPEQQARIDAELAADEDLQAALRRLDERLAPLKKRLLNAKTS